MQGRNIVPGVPNTKMTAIRSFSDPDVFPSASKTLRGVTRDSTGAVLGSVTCDLENAANKVVEQSQVSDANGNYLFVAPETSVYQVEGYKAGSPDVTGATVNTLVPSEGG